MDLGSKIMQCADLIALPWKLPSVSSSSSVNASSTASPVIMLALAGVDTKVHIYVSTRVGSSVSLEGACIIHMFHINLLMPVCCLVVTLVHESTDLGRS